MPNPVKALWKYLKNAGSEIGTELKRQAAHGSAEVGNVLYTGSAYAQYGPEPERPKPPAEEHSKPSVEEQQQSKAAEPEQAQKQKPVKEREIKPPEQVRGGREM